MQPYDYTIDTPDAFTSAMKGYQLGLGLKEHDQDRELELQKMQAEAKQQQMLNSDLMAVSSNPSPDAIAKLSIKYPQLAEKLKNSFSMWDQSTKDTKINTAVPIYAAVQKGEYGIALDKLEEQAKAYDNSGDAQQAESTRAIAKSIESHPKQAKLSFGMYLSGLMGADKFAQTFGDLQKIQEGLDKAPVELDKLQAETEIKNIEAENLPREKALVMEKQTQDIETSKLERKLKVIDARIKKTNSETEIEKLNLELEKTLGALEAKKQEKSEAAQVVMDTTSQGLNLTNEILAPENKKYLEYAFGKSAWVGSIPGSKTKTIAGKIEQLSNILAMGNIDKLPGAMSDKDILFLKSINANLDRYQNEGMGIKELERIKGALERVQSKYANSGKLPTEGGAFVKKLNDGRVITEGVINKMMSLRPELTREDILKRLGN